MSSSLADLHFQWQRAVGLFRRGLGSLRARGWRSTWERVKRQLRRVPPAQRVELYRPSASAFAAFAVPASTQPRASVIIPVYNQADYTLECLRALAAHPPLAGCEIWVIDDGSSDSTQAWMEQIQGLHYHRRAHNGGFIAACNDGAARARGEFLIFLNNDTVPQPGWLDALLQTFDDLPEAGLVGAQLLYPDGRLQEAGGVVFADGSAWNYGRFESPQDPRFASLRDADYCSGAALAIPRSLFQSLGGFDTRYAPAYYEDTDLAFAVRGAGRRVLYQPGSRVLHLEGISSGTDLSSGAKAYQVRNQGIFEHKWRAALARQPAAGSVPTPAVLHARQRQILVVDETLPHADRDSASLRLLNLLRMLVSEGAHVVFLAAEHAEHGRDLERVRGLGVEVWQAPFSGRPQAWLAAHGRRFDVVLLCRHYLAEHMLPLVRRQAPQARVVLDTVDLHYLRESRAAALAGSSVLGKAAQRTRVRELAVINACDTTLVVSANEQQLLAVDAPQARVEVVSNLHEVAGPGPGFAQRRDLLFVGGFRHAPNTDAVLWFVEQVMPLLRAQLPELVFHCIGSDPPAQILALGAQPGVRIHGYVPDLEPAMRDLRVAVAPLRFGAGVKGKINLSMAHGQPVVATAIAVEGMHLRDGEEVLVADTPQAFADAVLRLYRDEALWQHLAGNGLDNVQQHFSLHAAQATVQRVFFG